MIALGFSNLVFLSYLFYLIAENKKAVIKHQKFWWLLLGLGFSLYMTYLVLGRKHSCLF